MKYLKHIILTLVLLVQASFSHSESKQIVRDLMNKVIESYGGDHLKNAKYLTLYNDMQLAWPGQGYSSSHVNFDSDKYILKFNLKDKKSSVEHWQSQNGNIYHNRTISDGSGSFIVDYLTNEYLMAENQTFESHIGLYTMYSDLLLAYAMINRSEDFSYGGKGYFQGKASDILLFKYREKSEALKIYVSIDNGLVNQIQRILSSGDVLTSIYSKHKKLNELTYSTENRIFRNAVLTQFSMNESISTDKIPDNIFTLDKHFKKQQEMIDSSGMKAQQVTSGIFHVQANGDFSTFFKDKDHFIGVNAYVGLNDRIAELHQIENLPIKYMIVTHHHSDHISGVKDAIDAGASLIMTAMTFEILNKSEDYNLKDVEVIVVDDSLQVGPVKIFMIPTNHAAQNLVVYHAKDKVLYQDDHYNASTKNKHSPINQSGLVLNQKLSDLNLEIKLILGGHGPKAEKWKDFQKAVNSNTLNNICPSKREICINEQP